MRGPGLVALALVLAATLHAAQKIDPAEIRLQAAINKETVEGDLKGAITEFQRIVNTEGVSRAVAATALLHLGQCHEKLGTAEARRAYERLLKDYADQVEVARLARARLATLADAGTSSGNDVLRGRRIIGPSQHLRVAVSPDGRYVAYCCSVSAAMVVHDVASGREGTLPVDPAAAPRFAPDNEAIAYVASRSGATPELRVVKRTGSGDRLLFQAADATNISLYDWMPDGSALLVRLARVDKTTEMALVPAAGGAPRRIASPAPAGGGSLAGALSPDGRYFAYRAQAAGAGGTWTTRLFTMDSGSDTPLVERPANAWNVGWTADGRFAFYSADSYSEGIWTVKVAEGKAQGPPERTVGRLDDSTRAVGVTRRGQLFYQNDVVDLDIHLAPVPPASGTLEPVRVLNGATAPAWSPDGRFLAYGERGSGLIFIHTLATGATRTLWTGLPGIIMALAWFPDHTALAAQGLGPDNTRNSVGLYRADLVSGSLSDVVLGANWLEFGANPTLSPDGTAVMYKASEGPGATALIRYNLQTRQREVLLQRKAPEYVSGFAVLPRTGQIAVALAEPGPPASGGATRETISAIGLLDQATREVRVIHRLPQGTYLPSAVTLAWMMDGKSLLFVSAPRATNGSPMSLFRIPVSGGQPEKLFEAALIFQVRVHPDGNQVALDTRAYKMETRIVENLFAAAKK